MTFFYSWGGWQKRRGTSVLLTPHPPTQPQMLPLHLYGCRQSPSFCQDSLHGPRPHLSLQQKLTEALCSKRMNNVVEKKHLWFDPRIDFVYLKPKYIYIYYDSQTHKIWPSLILLPLAMWMIRVWDPLQRLHLLPLLFKSTNHIGIILSSLQLWATFHTKEKRGCQHAFYSLPKKYVFSYAIFPRASTGKYSGEKQMILHFG